VFTIQLFSRLDFLLSIPLKDWIKLNLPNLAASIISFHGFVWLGVAAALLIILRNGGRRYIVVFLLAQAAFFVISFFTKDITRVFALLAWPTAIHAILHAYNLALQNPRSNVSANFILFLLAVAVLGLIAPGYFVWEGQIHFPELIWGLSTIFP
jgi:hypothetical protein